MNDPQTEFVNEAERHLRARLLVGTESTSQERNRSLAVLKLLNNDVTGLDLIDFCLSQCSDQDYRVEEMARILDSSGSAWAVGVDEDELFCLERRVIAAVATSARAAIDSPGKAATYLSSAWHSAYGRSPSPSASYRDAVRAVEAAARPIVTPNDQVATLGKMVSAMRDAPAKWTTAIGDTEFVLRMMATVWHAQHDRHGTDDDSVPVNVTQAEAEAALHLAVTLVHLFRSGAIRRSV